MTRTLWLLLAVFVVPCIVFSGYRGISTYGAAGHLVFILAAALLFWSAAVAASSSVEKIYYQLSIALFIWSTAVIFRILEAMLNQPAYGTVADAFWAPGYLVFLSGAFLWFRSAAPSRRRILWTLGLVICAFGLIFILILNPLVEDSSRSVLLKTLDVFFVAVDLMVLGFLSAPASKPGSSGSRIMLCGVLILLVSDLLFIGVATIPHSSMLQYLDVPYTLGDFLLALAASRQRELLLSPQ